MNIFNRTLLIVLLLFVSTAAPSFADELKPTKDYLMRTAQLFSEIIEKTKPAVVYIQVTKKVSTNNSAMEKFSPELEEFFGKKKKGADDNFFDDQPTYSYGSGFIYNSDGFIITNSHVIKDATKVTVTLTDKRQFSAKVIGIDPKTDIGLIKIEAKDIPSISLGNSDLLKSGHWVLAIGSPYEYIQTVTAGIISATGRNALGISDYESFIQTDAAINPGNSGGPLVNIEGEVIGMNTAFLTQTGGYMGIGFAIPINMVRKVTEQLIDHGKVIRAWLGVALKDGTVDTPSLNLTSNQAARIVGVKKDSPAERAGFQKGDLIITINGAPIAGAADLRNRVSLCPPNSEVTIEYVRDQLKRVEKLTLGVLK
ncbi:MAG: serine protease Do [Desulforhopalus sp.]|jgi:serine protease Do